MAEYRHAYEFTIYSNDVDIVICSLKYFSSEQLLTTDANWYKYNISVSFLNDILEKMVNHWSKAEDNRYRLKEDNIKKSATHPNMSQSILEKIILDYRSNRNDIEEIIVPLITSGDFLRNLSKIPKYRTLNYIAANLNTPIDVLKELARNQDVGGYITANVASNPSTPDSIAKYIIDDNSHYGRNHQIASNPNTPLSRLKYLMDNYSIVHPSIVKNPNASTEMLDLLAKKVDFRSDPHFASNPNTPVHILEKLTGPGSNSEVAGNLSTPIYLLEKIVKSGGSQEVAKNINTPLYLLEISARDENSYVRRAVIQNTNTSSKILALLAKDKENEISRAAKRHHNYDPNYKEPPSPIVIQTAPVVTQSNNTAIKGKSKQQQTPKSSSPCYIATAAYGSPYASEVDTFRYFRDTVLVKSWFGRAFIAFYYKTSPPLADFIAKREYLKAATRKWILAPLLHFLRKK